MPTKAESQAQVPAEPTLEEGALAALKAGIEAAPSDVVEPLVELPVEAVEAAEEEAAPIEAAPVEGDAAPIEAAADPELDDIAREAVDLGVKNERAQARFRELSEKAARLPDLEARANRGDELVRYVADTGCDQVQFNAMLGYMQAINKGGPTEWALAREALTKELEFLDAKLGRKGPNGADPVTAHADLREAVEAGEITRERAEELASLRGFQQAAIGHKQQAEQQVTRSTQERQQGVESLNALEVSLRSRDPQYDAKRQFALERFQSRIHTIPPQRWAEEFMLDYVAVQAPAPAPAPTPKAPVGHVPLRPQGGGTGMGKVATSAEEALRMGVEAASRGERAW